MRVRDGIDCIEVPARNREERIMRVHELMTTGVATVRPDTPLKDVALQLAERGISGMPVVDEEGAVLGVVSESDILAKALPEADEASSLLGRLLDRQDTETQRRLDARIASDAMTAPAVTIDGGVQVSTAAQRMLESDVNRLPVVEQGRLVGLISRADLVRAFARTDDAMAEEIRDLVGLQQELWRDERPVEVSIAQGEVTLSGHLRAADEAAVLAKMVRTVPGVVSVETEITWAEA
jgi:CBS domain-containing protein